MSEEVRRDLWVKKKSRVDLPVKYTLKIQGDEEQILDFFAF